MIPFFIKLTIERPPEIAVRRWSRITREAHLQEGRYWYKHYLPEHFKRSAKTKYAHQPRKLSYLAKKWKAAKQGKVKYGGMIDNVYSGNMEEMLKSIAQVRPYPSRVRVTMQGPRYITMRAFRGDRARAVKEGWTYGRGKKFRKYKGLQTNPFRGNQPDKRKELTTITDEEGQKLSEILHQSVISSLEKIRSPKVVVLN